MINKCKRLISLALIFFMFVFPAIAMAAERYFPGDEWPAEQNQIGTVDVHTEKELDSFMYPVNFFITSAAGLSGAGIIAQTQVQGMFKKIFTDMAKKYALKYGYIPGAVGTVGIANQSPALLWMNWPPSKYTFGSAEEKSLNIIGATGKNWLTELMNGLANMFFGATKCFVLLANNIIFLAFDTQWVQSASDFISDTTSQVAGDFYGEGKYKFVRILFTLCLAILGAGLALYIAKGEVIQAFKIYMAAILSIAAIYIYVGNSNLFINKTADFTDAFAGAGLEMASVLSPATEQAVRSGLSPLEKGLVQATNAAWTAIVACPWSWGQFGTADISKLKLTYASNNMKSEWEALAEDLPDKRTVPPSGQGVRLSRNELESKAKKGQLYIDTLYLGSDDELRAKLLQVLSADQAGFIGSKNTIDHRNHPETVTSCQPSKSSIMRHLAVAFATLIPAAVYLALACYLAVPIIIAQLALIPLLIFLPLGLLVGVAGERGQFYQQMYLKQLLRAFSIKIVNGIYLGVVLFFGALISSVLLF